MNHNEKLKKVLCRLLDARERLEKARAEIVLAEVELRKSEDCIGPALRARGTTEALYRGCLFSASTDGQGFSYRPYKGVVLEDSGEEEVGEPEDWVFGAKKG